MIEDEKNIQDCDEGEVHCNKVKKVKIKSSISLSMIELPEESSKFTAIRAFNKRPSKKEHDTEDNDSENSSPNRLVQIIK
jgi:hypothetical protein